MATTCGVPRSTRFLSHRPRRLARALLGSVVVSHQAVTRIGWVVVAGEILGLGFLLFSPWHHAAFRAATSLGPSRVVAQK